MSRKARTKPIEDHPAFKVITPDGQAFSVWADGTVEGFGCGAIIINRIPFLIASAVAAIVEQGGTTA